MAKVIKKLRYGTLLEYEESDAIYSEGWTIGSVTPLAKSTNGGKTQGTGERQDQTAPHGTKGFSTVYRQTDANLNCDKCRGG